MRSRSGLGHGVDCAQGRGSGKAEIALETKGLVKASITLKAKGSVKALVMLGLGVRPCSFLLLFPS